VDNPVAARIGQELVALVLGRIYEEQLVPSAIVADRLCGRRGQAAAASAGGVDDPPANQQRAAADPLHLEQIATQIRVLRILRAGDDAVRGRLRCLRCCLLRNGNRPDRGEGEHGATNRKSFHWLLPWCGFARVVLLSQTRGPQKLTMV